MSLFTTRVEEPFDTSINNNNDTPFTPLFRSYFSDWAFFFSFLLFLFSLSLLFFCFVKFTSASSQNGKLFSWGCNESGQLGVGDRENHSRPKAASSLHIVQLEAGASHSIGLTTDGTVVVWGAGRSGQMGTGQFTSLSSPTPVQALVHRPVVQIAAGRGSNFCFALTVGGNLYGWGENNFGQLGTNDTKDRYKPTQIKALRVARVKSIQAGQYHCIAVVNSGTMFSWGKNNFGQCAHGRQEGGMNTLPVVCAPRVVERLNDTLLNKNIVDVACGLSHTLLLLENKADTTTVVLGFGLNSSGQLGLGHRNNTSRPKKLQFNATGSGSFAKATEGKEFKEENTELVPSSVYCGHHHSFVVCDVVTAHGANGSAIGQRRDQQRTVPSLHYSKIRQLLSSVVGPSATNGTLTGMNSASYQRLQLFVFSSFSSVSVLNASFLSATNGVHNVVHRATESNSGLDMLSVRQSYQALLSFGGGVLETRLGQATYRLVDLLSSCPFDEIENLRVFLIVFENPILLNASSNHVVIQKFVNALLRLPLEQRNVVFMWIAQLASEYFAAVVRVLQNFLNFMSKEKKINVSSGSDTTPCCLILAHLYEINVANNILPERSFYNEAISRMSPLALQQDYRKWCSPSGTNVHSICKTCAFLLDPEAKRRLVRVDATDRMSDEVSKFSGYRTGHRFLSFRAPTH